MSETTRILPVWQETIQVKAFESDLNARWKPSAILQALTEAASQHAANLGFDFPSMHARQMVWVLSRFKIRFYEIPAIGEVVRIKTWPKGIQQRLFFMRDFELSAPDGRLLMTASFAWLLVNPLARRILPPASLQGNIPDNGGRAALDEPLDKINLPDALVERFTVYAGYSTIDLLGHANSARYVDWICDCFSTQEHTDARLDWLQLNYINETRPGERVALSAGQDAGNPAAWYLLGKNLDTGQKSFEAALAWKKR